MIQYRAKKRLSFLICTFYLAVMVLPGRGIVFAQEGPSPVKEMRMSLMDCVETALKNNTDIIVERLNVMIAENDYIGAKSDFDVSVNADVNYQSLETPSGSQLSGAAVSEQENLTWSVGANKRFITGGILQLSLQSERQETNSSFVSLNPQYTSNLTLTLTQPLLKNFGPMTNRLRITLSEANRELSQFMLESTILETATRVEEAYWNLVNATELLHVQRQNLELAQDLLEQARAQVRAGVAPPVFTIQAESTVASRSESVIVAENSVNTAQNNLKIIMNVVPGTEIWDIVIVPSDRPDPNVKRPPLEEMYKEGLANNLNMKQLKTNLKSQLRTAKVYKRLLLPRLDLIASAGLSGLAGDAEKIQGQEHPFQGGYEDSLDSMLSDNYFSYSAGLRLEMPIRNRAARSTYKKALLEQKRLEAEIARTELTISFVLKNRVGDVESNIRRVEAARAAAKLARENMEAEQKRFKLGLVTQHDVLQAQQDYAQARTNEIKSLIDYNISVSRLERAKAGYLDLGLTGGAQQQPTISAVPEPTQTEPAATGTLEPKMGF